CVGGMCLAGGSMVVPGVRASVRGPKRFALNRDFAQNHRSQLQQAQNNYRNKPHTARGTMKPLANNGLLSATSRARDWVATQHAPINVDLPENVMLPPHASKANDELTARLTHPQPVVVTPELRKKLQIRPTGAPTETAAARQSRLAKKFAEQKKGLTRGGSRPASGSVLPSNQLADDSSFSAVGFVGLSGTEDFFNEAVLLADVDGVHNTANSFDGANVPRELVDTQAKVEDDVLLPDEVYT